MMRCAGGRVEVPGRLVGEEELGAIDEGAGDGDPLLLAPGQLGREVVAAAGEPDAREQVLRPRGGVALAAELEGNLDVLLRAQRRNQLKALEHEPNFLAADAARARPRRAC